MWKRRILLEQTTQREQFKNLNWEKITLNVQNNIKRPNLKAKVKSTRKSCEIAFQSPKQPIKKFAREQLVANKLSRAINALLSETFYGITVGRGVTGASRPLFPVCKTLPTNLAHYHSSRYLDHLLFFEGIY